MAPSCLNMSSYRVDPFQIKFHDLWTNNDTSVDPKQQVYFEIKKPPWVSVVWVVIACCICSKHDPCICNKKCNVTLSASNALVAAKSCERSCHHWNRQEQAGGKIFATQKSFDGASEASGVFNSNETNFDGASEASGVLLAIKTKLWRSERSERSFLFAINIILLS